MAVRHRFMRRRAVRRPTNLVHLVLKASFGGSPSPRLAQLSRTKSAIPLKAACQHDRSKVGHTSERVKIAKSQVEDYGRLVCIRLRLWRSTLDDQTSIRGPRDSPKWPTCTRSDSGILPALAWISSPRTPRRTSSGVRGRT